MIRNDGGGGGGDLGSFFAGAGDCILWYNQLMKTSVYPAVFNPTPEGWYEVSFPDFPGCVTFGHTLPEAKEMAGEVLGLWIEELEAQHQPVPRPSSAQPIIAEISANV